MSNLRTASAGRIKKPGPRRAYVNAATLEQVGMLAGEAVLQSAASSSKRVAIAARTDMARDNITPENVASVTTISLLRLRVWIMQGESQKLWRAYTGMPFTWFRCDVAALEGEGTAQVREGRLRAAIAGIRAQFDSNMRKVVVDQAALKRWRRANRGAGRVARMIKAHALAVEAELERREGEDAGCEQGAIAHTVEAEVGASDVGPSSAVGQTSAAVDIMPASYAEDIRRIHRNLDAEEAGVRKPSSNERAIAARSAAFDRGDMDMVRAYDAQIERRQCARRRARQRKKARRDAMRGYVVPNEGRDPRSDDEDCAQ